MVDIRKKNIHDRLKEYDRWLLWDASSDTPRRPHWRGDFGISWSDPNDWVSFEDAVAAADERESWGIGFVFTKDFELSCIDIDGPFGNDGDPREWFPGLDAFTAADAYMEWSPGRGIHVPVADGAPDWWSDCEVGPDIHQGVDFLENKFCTVTGDVLDESGDTILDETPKSWLTEAYYKIRGELPQRAGQGTPSESEPDAELSQSQVEAALSHCNPDAPHSQWVRLAYAVHDWDDGPTGKSVFESWSSGSSKWDRDAERSIEHVWGRSSSQTDISVGTLVHHAEQGGWEPPWSGTGDGKTTAEIVDHVDYLLEQASEEADGLTDSKQARLQNYAAELPAEEYEERAGAIADATDVSRTRLDTHRELATHAKEFARVRVEHGATWYITKSEPYGTTKILNFELDVKSILRMDSEEWIEASLGAGRQIQFSPTKLQRPQRFRDLIGDYVGLTFTPPPQMARDVLNEINEYVAALDVPVRQGTHHMGLHGDEFVTPKGSLTADGWADEPEVVYVERNLGIERKIKMPDDEPDVETDIDDGPTLYTDDLLDIIKALPNIRQTDRILPVLSWFYAAPIRPLIFEDWNAGQFNHLNITGDTGSGKTTTLRYLWRCFGLKGDPFSVTDTKFTMTATMAASNGLPIWYDEYKPSTIQEYKLDGFHELYRKSATGQIESRGNADQSTTEYELKAPLVVSGEEQIRLPAERRRSIMVAFTKSVTEKGSDTRLAFKNLAGEGHVEDGELVLPESVPDPKVHAYHYYTWLTGMDNADLREWWQDAREQVWELRQDWPDDHDLDDLEVQGLQTVAFGWRVMREFAMAHDIDEYYLPDEAELDRGLRHVAGEIGDGGSRKSHMDEFVELFVRAHTVGYVSRGDHFEFVREGTAEEELRIHLNQTFDAVSKYAKDHDLDSADLLSNAQDYRKRFKEAAESEGGYVREWSQNTPGLGRCVGINTVAAMNRLDFDRAHFDVKPMGGESPDLAAADGGDEIVSVKQRVMQELQGPAYEAGDGIRAPSLSGEIGGNPERVKAALEQIARETSLITATEDGEWEKL